MDHPNAIYFLVAANAVFLSLGLLFIAGSMNKGPYKAVSFIPKWSLFSLGLLLVAFNLFGLFQKLGHSFGV